MASQRSVFLVSPTSQPYMRLEISPVYLIAKFLRQGYHMVFHCSIIHQAMIGWPPSRS